MSFENDKKLKTIDSLAWLEDPGVVGSMGENDNKSQLTNFLRSIDESKNLIFEHVQSKDHAIQTQQLRVSQLIAEINQSKREITSLENLNLKLNEEARILKKELEQARSAVNRLELKEQKTTFENALVKSETSSRIEKLETIIENLRKMIATKDVENAKLQIQLAGYVHLEKELKQKLAREETDSRSQIEKLKIELAQLKEENQRLEASESLISKEAQSNLKSYQKRIDELTGELRSIHASWSEAKESLAIRDIELRFEKEESQKQKTYYASQMEKLKEDHRGQFETVLALQEREVSQRDLKIQELETALDNSIKERDREIKYRDKTIQELSSEITEKANRNEAEVEKRSEMNGELRLAYQNIHFLREEIERLKRESDTLAKSFEAEINAKSSENLEQRKTIESLRDQIHQLRSQEKDLELERRAYERDEKERQRAREVQLLRRLEYRENEMRSRFEQRLENERLKNAERIEEERMRLERVLRDSQQKQNEERLLVERERAKLENLYERFSERVEAIYREIWEDLQKRMTKSENFRVLGQVFRPGRTNVTEPRDIVNGWIHDLIKEKLDSKE